MDGELGSGRSSILQTVAHWVTGLRPYRARRDLAEEAFAGPTGHERAVQAPGNGIAFERSQ
jgi:hypothetical protein